MRWLAACSILLLAFAVACSGSSESDGGSSSSGGQDAGTGDPLDSHGCDHMLYGAEEPVTASATEANAPMVMTGHHRTDVTLPATATANEFSGAIVVMPPEAGLVNFYFDAAVAVVFKTTAGAVLTPTQTGALDVCQQVAVRTVVHVPAQGAVLLFGPTMGQLVKVVARHPEDGAMHMHGDGGGREDGAGHMHDDGGGMVDGG